MCVSVQNRILVREGLGVRISRITSENRFGREREREKETAPWYHEWYTAESKDSTDV